MELIFYFQNILDRAWNKIYMFELIFNWQNIPDRTSRRTVSQFKFFFINKTMSVIFQLDIG